MMFDYGIGLDCAGYTQQAFQASRGLSPAQANMKDLVTEDLTNLRAKGFVRIAASDARSGDILSLGPPRPGDTGHRIIVNDTWIASDNELADFRHDGIAGFEAGHVTTLQVESSWGAGGDPARGGVAQDVLWHDDVSGKWARKNGGAVDVMGTPYNYPLIGIFRPAKEIKP